MSRSSAQKSSVSIHKKPEGIPVFDPSAYTTKNLTIEDVVKLKECFDVFDYDKSGSVSAEELVSAIRALGLEQNASKILHIVSTQSDGEEMDFTTFLSIFGFSSETNSEKSLKQLFEIFDKNSEGSFGIEEFRKVCEEVGERFNETEIEQMIKYADKDGDGRINYQEFVDIVTKEYPSV